MYILFFFILIIGAQLTPESKFKNYLGIISFIFLLLIGFRRISVGIDTWNYCMDFEEYSKYGKQELTDALNNSPEPLYVLITWIVGQFGNSYTTFLFVWTLLIAYPLYLIQKTELVVPKDVLISYIAIFILSIWAFFVAGIRQTAAIGMVLCSYKYLKLPVRKGFLFDSNAWKFYILIAIGYCIHNSIVVFGLIYPFKRVLQTATVKWWYLLLIVIIFYLGSTVTGNQLHQVTMFLFQERFNQYGNTVESELNTSAFIMQSIIMTICFLSHKKLQCADNSNTLLLNLAIIALIFQSMAGAVGEMARLSFYFSVFYIILLPRALRQLCIDVKSEFVYLGFVSISLFYLFFLASASLPEYKFFWQ